jgi:hypothetical protein
MKVTYITHACVLIEVGGVTLLTDPWIVGPCWGGNIWHYPPPRMTPEDFSHIDYIYFSHAHDDHLHPLSLGRFRTAIKKSKVLIPDFGLSYFEKAVRANGFGDVTLLGHEEAIEIAPNVKVEMLLNDQGDHDSSLLIQADGVKIFFQTDSMITLDEAKRLGEKHRIDVAFTITSWTGIYPGFFDFPIETMIRLAHDKRERALKDSIELVVALGAKVAIPYASDLCYLGALYFANGLHSADKREFKRLALEKGVDCETLLMGPGDWFELDAGVMTRQIGDHDFGMTALAAYAVQKRHEVFIADLEERCYESVSCLPDVRLMRDILDSHAPSWQGEKFKVLWKVINQAGEVHSFGQELPGRTEDCDADWYYDLSIEIPSYRLQRLARGDYHMGFLTMWNGSIRCHRHVEKLTESEKNFWNWAFKNINFPKRVN